MIEIVDEQKGATVRRNALPGRNCAAMTKRGKPCRGKAAAGDIYCSRHKRSKPIELQEDVPPSIVLLEELAVTQARVRWLHEAIERYRKEAPDMPGALMATHQLAIAWERAERQHLTKLLDVALRNEIDPYLAKTPHAMAQRAVEAFHVAIDICGLEEDTALRLKQAMAAALRNAKARHKISGPPATSGNSCL